MILWLRSARKKIKRLEKDVSAAKADTEQLKVFTSRQQAYLAATDRRLKDKARLSTSPSEQEYLKPLETIGLDPQAPIPPPYVRRGNSDHRYKAIEDDYGGAYIDLVNGSNPDINTAYEDLPADGGYRTHNYQPLPRGRRQSIYARYESIHGGKVRSNALPIYGTYGPDILVASQRSPHDQDPRLNDDKQSVTLSEKL